MRLKYLILIIFISLGLGFFGGIWFEKLSTPPKINLRELTNQDLGKPEGVDFSIFWDAWNLINQKYVDRSKLDFQNMVLGAIEGMVKSLNDPYTVLLREKESKRLEEDIKGEFFGIGIEIGMRNGDLTIISPIKDTPAEKAGLLAGDKILKIDDKSTVDINLDEAVSLIRGKKGTKVTLTILRKKGNEEETKEITITRAKIKIPIITWKKIEPNIGYIQLHTFSQNAKIDFDKAIKELRDNNVDLNKLILDLRNNPGGLLDMAVEISSYFLDPGNLVVIEDFGNGEKEELRSKQNGQLKNSTVVILINKGSASASEIVAGALHDNKKIKLIGEKTFGKGSVQQIEKLKYDDTSLKITVAKWLTPNGRSITDEGIEPDIKVERTEKDIEENKDPQLEKAIEIIKSL